LVNGTRRSICKLAMTGRREGGQSTEGHSGTNRSGRRDAAADEPAERVIPATTGRAASHSIEIIDSDASAVNNPCFETPQASIAKTRPIV
jgi:hypothetical protein